MAALGALGIFEMDSLLAGGTGKQLHAIAPSSTTYHRMHAEMRKVRITSATIMRHHTQMAFTGDHKSSPGFDSAECTSLNAEDLHTRRASCAPPTNRYGRPDRRSYSAFLNASCFALISGYFNPRIRAARIAAFLAPGFPMATPATGMPGGI